MNNKKITFYINNEAYTINIGSDDNNKFETQLSKSIPQNKNINTKELLTAYIQKTHELLELESKLEQLSNKLPVV